MTTELSVYDRIDNPVQAMEFLGNAIAESGIFGCSNKQQGIVLAWECLASRTSALSLARTNHIIGNKLSMKADAMVAQFNERGGTHRIIERSPERCVIEFIAKDGTKYQMSLSWEEAQGEPFPYETKGGKKESEIVAEIIAWKSGKGQQPQLKPKYGTPRARMQMLYARLMSDSIRAIDPGVNYGQYPPEELDDDQPENGDVERKPRKSAKQVMEEAAKANSGEVVDAAYEVVASHGTSGPTTQQTESASGASPATTTEQWATSTQVEQIRNYFNLLGVDADAQQEILRKKKVNSLRSLTCGQAAEMVTKLIAKANEVAETKQTDAGLDVSNATSMEVDGPCTSDQVTAIKTLIAEIEQLQPGTTQKVKDRLLSVGLQKIVDLTYREAEILENSLKIKNMEAFFAASLKGFKPGN